MTFTYQVLLQDIQRYRVFWFLTQSTYNLKKKIIRVLFLKQAFFVKKTRRTYRQTDIHLIHSYQMNRIKSLTILLRENIRTHI